MKPSDEKPWFAQERRNLLPSAVEGHCERFAKWSFGTGAERHVAHWEAIKVVDKTEEEGDDGETIIREKECFSQRLTLLFADGRIQFLSEKPREDSGKEALNGERPPADGEVEVSAEDA